MRVSTSQPGQLSDPHQPLQEPLFACMTLANGLEAAHEGRDRAAFLGEGVEVEKEACRPIVTACVPALDFGLDFEPDLFGRPLREPVEPLAAFLLGLRLLAFVFGGGFFGLCLLTDKAHLLDTSLEIADRPQSP